MDITYILEERTPDGNGRVDYFGKEIAISNDRESLVNYCKKEFSSDIGKNKDNIWAKYYDIKESKLIIINKEV